MTQYRANIKAGGSVEFVGLGMHIQRYIEWCPSVPPYNNNIQVSIVEGKISLFRITSRAVVTPDITTQYDTGRLGRGKLGILTQYNMPVMSD